MGFEILVSANFPQMYLWIHDKIQLHKLQTVCMAEKTAWGVTNLLRHLFSASVAQWSGRCTLAQEAGYYVASNLRKDIFVFFAQFF